MNMLRQRVFHSSTSTSTIVPHVYRSVSFALHTGNMLSHMKINTTHNNNNTTTTSTTSTSTTTNTTSTILNSTQNHHNINNDNSNINSSKNDINNSNSSSSSSSILQSIVHTHIQSVADSLYSFCPDIHSNNNNVNNNIGEPKKCQFDDLILIRFK